MKSSLGSNNSAGKTRRRDFYVLVGNRSKIKGTMRHDGYRKINYTEGYFWVQ
jgi:hypothetical protein